MKYQEITPVEAAKMLAEAGATIPDLYFWDNPNNQKMKDDLEGVIYGRNFPFRSYRSCWKHCARAVEPLISAEQARAIKLLFPTARYVVMSRSKRAYCYAEEPVLDGYDEWCSGEISEEHYIPALKGYAQDWRKSLVRLDDALEEAREQQPAPASAFNYREALERLAKKWPGHAGVNYAVVSDADLVLLIEDAIGDFSQPVGSLITWEIKNDEVIRGTIAGHPKTTMFLLNAQFDGTIKLTGCFIPDDAERNDVYDLDNAKAAAEGYLLGWLRTVGAAILSANGPEGGNAQTEQRP